jgi:hypothetical protein
VNVYTTSDCSGAATVQQSACGSLYSPGYRAPNADQTLTGYLGVQCSIDTPVSRPQPTPTLSAPFSVRATKRPSAVPTRAPTPLPTGAPSPAPTVSAVNVKVSQFLSGVDYSDFQANQAAYKTTLRNAYSEVLDVPISAIHGLTVTASSRRSRQLLNAGINVAFMVVTNIQSISSTSLMESLSTATSTGTLASTIQSQAFANGCSTLAR